MTSIIIFVLLPILVLGVVVYNRLQKKGSVSASLNMMHVDYDDFSDLTALQPIGSEPLCKLDADIFQIFVSPWH